MPPKVNILLQHNDDMTSHLLLLLAGLMKRRLLVRGKRGGNAEKHAKPGLSPNPCRSRLLCCTYQVDFERGVSLTHTLSASTCDSQCHLPTPLASQSFTLLLATDKRQIRSRPPDKASAANIVASLSSPLYSWIQAPQRLRLMCSDTSAL